VPRDPTWQWQRRLREQELRSEAVALVTAGQEHGQSLPEVARRLELPPRTLRDWCQAGRDGAGLAKALGRPHARLASESAQEVVRYLHSHGPWVGVPVLRAEFPTTARAELRDLLRLFRFLWAEAHPRYRHLLTWHRVGAVWAMDFAKVKQLIDGVYPYVFAVRDLASGMQLAWRAVPDLTSATVQSELRLLFTVYGAPLVLKSDNGSAFRAEEQKRFLRPWQVWPLYSPPGQPGYNGAIEASIGSLKRRTEFEAYRQGHAGQWGAADLEAARELANESGGSRVPEGASPRGAWEGRRPPSQGERDRFAQAVRQDEEVVRREEGIDPAAALEHYEQAALHRRVLTQVLVEHGLLTITRRRIPQTFFGQKVANI
jgi:transposase InsO family protein/transposase-like protein